MIQSSVTVSLVPEARGGPFVFWDDLPAACRKAKELGFDAVEVFPPGPDAVGIEVLRKLLGDHGLGLAAVGTGAGWVKQRLNLTLPDAGQRAKAREFIKSIIDFAGPLGAPAIIGSMQGRSGEEVDRRHGASACSAESLDELGRTCRPILGAAVVRTLNRYETNLISNIESGLRLLKSLSTRNVKLLADLFHMNIEDVDIAGGLRDCGSHLGHLHFVDSNRRPAGLGHLDYGADRGRRASRIGYAGYASAEALPYPDSDAAARQTIEMFRRCFRHRLRNFAHMLKHLLIHPQNQRSAGPRRPPRQSADRRRQLSCVFQEGAATPKSSRST